MNRRRPHFSFHLDAMNPAIPAQVRQLYEKAPRYIRRDFDLWMETAAAVAQAPRGQKRFVARRYGRRIGVRATTVFSKLAKFHKRGPIALLNKTFSADCWPARRNGLPAPAIAHLKKLADDGQLTAQAAVRAFTAQLRRWKNGDATAAIPGYTEVPKGKLPRGWTDRNLTRYLALRPKRPITWRTVICYRSDGVVLSTKTTKLK
jgi:hypothetical protein